MLYRTLDWKVKEGIGYLILNQPPANAMTLEFFRELDDMVKSIKTLAELTGIIVTGNGRHFSSGAELDELTGGIIAQLRFKPDGSIVHFPGFMQKNLENLFFLSELKIPVIAAIRGVCIGSAYELALFCHFRLCSPNAVIGLPESSFGLIPGLGGIQQLLRNTTKINAMEMVFRGSTSDAGEALKKGMVDRIFQKNELMDAAQRLVKIASADYHQYNKNDYLHQLDQYISAI